ncbi:BgtAc-31097 [Blumeria graminis f. sp. tritici]|uniref:BgtAc-31097 n=2 Tax=Blumeria graminis f. sp. tritici TaxID=62690 RepID=A0A9X9QEN1_BLUGR|nr:hypothetical protein BGT96224_Ac31097 [Blumeria graminis f. sp. tritici 96224]VDB90761.1 BgtAc-31097 [Blumeria graminis f. sp. tritici]
MRGLWGIVTGTEKKPSDPNEDENDSCITRERISRLLIKNALGPVDYHQAQSAKAAANIWGILTSFHQITGAQGIVDAIWNFWSKRCAGNESAREHIGDIMAMHMELAELGIVIDD